MGLRQVSQNDIVDRVPAGSPCLGAIAQKADRIRVDRWFWSLISTPVAGEPAIEDIDVNGIPARRVVFRAFAEVKERYVIAP